MNEPELATRAAGRHVCVVGGGIGGLVSAWEFAKVGMGVTLIEAADDLGGAIRTAEIAGIRVDAGAESFATRGGHVAALLAELGLDDRVVSPNAEGAWVAGIPGVGAAPLPTGLLLGIPDNPFRKDVRPIIGRRGAWRAYLDRLRPPLTVGHEQSLGRLVTSRLGRAVHDRLVAPITSGVYSANPDDIDPDVAAPGLNAALTRTGSLTGAVADLLADRPTATPGGGVQGISGGMSLLVSALRDQLDMYGVHILTGTRVNKLVRSENTWTVHTESEPVVADAVVVATGGEEAWRLLVPHIPGLVAPSPPPVVEIVTLVITAPALDVAPRGSGVLTVPDSHSAKALTHATAKWAWLRESADGRHVVRVSFGTLNRPPETASLDDDAAVELALAQASALLGVPLSRDALAGFHRALFEQSQPGAMIGAGARRETARALIDAVPGLAAVGAWLSGTGLAQVIPDARATADRQRSALLWGDGEQRDEVSSADAERGI